MDNIVYMWICPAIIIMVISWSAWMEGFRVKYSFANIMMAVAFGALYIIKVICTVNDDV